MTVRARSRPSAADDAKWFHVMAWQGGGSRLVELDEIAPGRTGRPSRSPSTATGRRWSAAHGQRDPRRCPSTCPATPRSRPPRSPRSPRFERAFQLDHEVLRREERRCRAVARRRRLRRSSRVVALAWLLAIGAAVTRFERRAARSRVTLQPRHAPAFDWGMKTNLMVTAALAAFGACSAGTGVGQDEQGGQAGGQEGVPDSARHRRRPPARRSRPVRHSFGKLRQREGARGQGRAQGGQAQRREGCREERERTEESIAAFARSTAPTLTRSLRQVRLASARRPSARSRTRTTPRRPRIKTNAAKECDAERDGGREAFEEKYGTNKNKKNAFGKCVSEKAHEDAEGRRRRLVEPTWQGRRAGSSPRRAACPRGFDTLSAARIVSLL